MTNHTPDDPRNEAMAEAVQRTPRTFSVADLCGLDADNEDHAINARREYDRERRW
jgi:hypothetical protein